ncbi:MAG: C4-type zinc ribbon domain-containing protein [Deltaproteobacteria bacterium]|nr:C4-type zinc ribbon domain-containing protein [Deltaproteobacteria bacterium]
MKENIRTLIALQKLDNQIARWRQIAAEGPVKLAQAREKLTVLEEKQAALKANLAGNSQRRRELEGESADLVSKKAINQTRQLKAKNNEEYRAVLKEAETIGIQLAAKEDELLSLMEEAEKLDAEVPPAEEACLEEAGIFEELAREIERSVQESLTMEEQSQVARTKLTESLPRDILGRYLTVAKNRDGQALAPVSDGLCQICRLSVPPQLFNELQRNDRLLSCPNCARIIYWPEHPDFKPQPQPEEPSLEAHG